MRRVTLVFLALLAPAALLGQSKVESDVESVRVINLPEVQKVEIDAPAPHTRLLTVTEAVVSPAELADTASLTTGGTVETEGFGSAILTLAGQIKSDLYSSGAVGAVLVPDTALARTAFEEEQVILFPLVVQAPVTGEDTAYFQSGQTRVELAFPRYRVYFFNTTDRPAGVTLYAYLVN